MVVEVVILVVMGETKGVVVAEVVVAAAVGDRRLVRVQFLFHRKIEMLSKG